VRRLLSLLLSRAVASISLLAAVAGDTDVKNVVRFRDALDWYDVTRLVPCFAGRGTTGVLAPPQEHFTTGSRATAKLDASDGQCLDQNSGGRFLYLARAREGTRFDRRS
jgi:hypothetical protein